MGPELGQHPDESLSELYCNTQIGELRGGPGRGPLDTAH